MTRLSDFIIFKMVLMTTIMPVVESVMVLIAAVYLVRRYADKARTPTWCMILAYVGWFLGFSMVVFVPLDIFTTIKNGHASKWLIVWWNIFYWGSFVLNWTLFPFAVAYLDAGEFTTKGKVCAALKA